MRPARRILSAFLALSLLLSQPLAWANESPPVTPSGPTSAVPPPIITPAPPAPNDPMGPPKPNALPVPPSTPAPEVPAEAIAPPPEPLPPPRVAYQRRYNMAILGAATLVATWGADRLLAQDFPSPYKEPPWIPIIGPWFLLQGQTNTAAPNKFTMSLLVFDGLLQAGGLTIGILGLILKKRRMVVALPANP